MTIQEIEKFKETRECKAAAALEDAVNDMLFSPTKFAQAVTMWHPTLQQTFGRVIAAVITKYATEDIYTDGRNQAFSDMCKALYNTKEFQEVSLPFV